ncbi:GntR family transcriptional regulator [Parenemella sanctibonifatiensis]|uniref:GntR family transcriptional regulator n=1 Tax=Parenemella sanctibonifatiensis TaxID=2016505 RepID=A0A255EAS2_9ACTN|nr:GntR family transcriptional regulator [Parenemella sanctibonifatiensis]OYN88616.1 GntR family transcriptional regulator [Parenemella sanctibonifatiensis]
MTQIDGTKVASKRAQVRALLEKRIAADLRPGDPIDSERALVRELGVSRVTVRQAIAQLVEDGLLERTHGKGTYVTGPRVNSRLHLMSFSREMRARGFEPATEVLEAVEVTAPEEVAEALDAEPGARFTRVERLRLADGTPMAHEVGYYPVAAFPGLAAHELASLYDVFAADYGVVVTRGEQTVRADSADEHRARMLQVTRRAPLLVQQRVSYGGDLPIEYATSWYRADRYQIHSTITPRGTSS